MSIWRKDLFKVIVFGLLFFAANFIAVCQLVHPYNLDFENGVKGSVPAGWTVNINSEKEGFAAITTDEYSLKGRYCLGMFVPQNSEDGKFFKVLQSINANIYAGKRVRLRAAIKFEKQTPGSGAYLWMKAKFDDGSDGIFKSTFKAQIADNTWKYYEIEGIIDNYARFMDFGITLNGWCNAWVDDISLEIIDTADITMLKKPAPIGPEAVANISAFAKMYGLIRYFYPSFESMKNDWDKFAFAGVEYFEKLKSPKELETALGDFYLPVAPGIEIYNTQKKPSKKLIADFPPKSIKNVALVNKYEGSRDLLNPDRLPFNIFTPAREIEGSVYQLMNAAPYAGKKMMLSCMARIESESPSGQGQIVIQLEKKFQKHSRREFLPNFSITGKQWKKYSLEMEIPADYDFIILQLTLIGEGKAYFDKVEFTLSEGGGNICKNPSFELERGIDLTHGWKINPNSEKAPYFYKIDKAMPFDGSQCLLIESDSAGIINIPAIGQIRSFELGSGMAMRMPAMLFIDSVQTLPYYTGNPAEKNLIGNTPAYYNIKDRTSRLALTVMAWNIFRHFSLSATNEKIWDEILKKCLEKAATDSTDEDFNETLGLLTTAAQDPQSRFWLTGKEYKNALPFLLKWINGKLYATVVSDKSKAKLAPGTEILEVSGKPVNEYLKDKSKYLAGSDSWKQLRAAALIRAGEAGSQVELKYRLPDNTIETGVFLKDIYIDELPEPRPERVTFYDPSGKLGDSLPGGYYYIDLTRISEEELDNGSGELSFAGGIVFDLRGIANVSYTILGYLTKDTLETFDWCLPVFTNPGSGFLSYRCDFRKIAPKPVQFKNNIIFLCDEKTVGNSELLLNLVRKYKLGRIAGSQSGGSPGVTTAFILPGGISFSMEEIRLRDRDSRQFIGSPIIPDIIINPSYEGIFMKEDEIVKKSLDILLK